ncbi:MAG: phage minor tail protein L [Mesorhizobium sp.]|nr:MAG: phage minor tail protein L [Mesorhizobium sp.]
MSALTQTVQTANPGEFVALFRLDVSSLGGQVMYFCQSAHEGAPISFGGITYTPVDVEFSGMEINAGGALPRPHVKVSAANGVFQQIINEFGDLLGVQIQRVRTFRQFLDGHEEADPTMYYGPDTFRVERKVEENPVFIEWELSAAIDQESKKIPGRQVIRDTCLWRYRQFNPNTGDFDYSRAQCPYALNVFFDRNGNSVPTAAQDQCGRKLGDCEKRFGEGNPLPFGGFPGVGRVRP